MKNTIIFVIMLLAILIFSGCGKTASNQSNNSSNTPKEAEKPINNLVDAIKSNKVLMCTYKDKTGVAGVFYSDNGKYKTEYSDSGKKQISNFDGNYYFYWMEGDAKGYKITQTCLDELVVGTNSTGSTNESESTGTVSDEVNNFNSEEELSNSSDVNCQMVNSVDLSIPSNISFADQCEVLKSAQKTINDLNSKANDIFDKAP